MEFQIPEDLSLYSVPGLETLRTTAATEYNGLVASVSRDTVTDDQIVTMTALRDFDATVAAEIAARTARGNAFDAAVTASTTTVEPVTEPTTTPAEPATTPVTDAPAEPTSAPIPAAPTTPVVTPGIADIAAGDSVTASTNSVDAAALTYGSLVAASDVPGFSASQTLDFDQLADAFIARTQGYNAYRGTNAYAEHGVAVFRRDYPADLVVHMDDNDKAVIAHATDETRLPGGSLVASSNITPAQAAAGRQFGNNNSLTAAIGWCSPSMTIYDTCLQVTTDGLAQFPEVQAPRGGIRHNTGTDWNAIYGNGTGYFNFTEAQIISGATKTCVTVDCPTFVDTRLGVTGLCITGNILQNRAYPEYVSTYIRGAMAASAHQINMLQIAAVVTASTAVDLTASAPFVGDGTVVSQIFSAIDMAIMDMKYRLRLGMASTLEVKLPYWVLAQMRADWIRRNANMNPNLADADISAFFSARNAAVDWVYDWQDAFSASGVGLGASTAITALPTQLVFLVYPTGTWVRAVSDVITLNSVYDSTKLASNQVTQLFTETGWAMAQMCPLSRAYTLNICPSGETGAQRTSSNTISC